MSARGLGRCESVLFAALAACGPSAERGDETTGASSQVPEPCAADESPFVREDCLEALRLACNQRTDESECAAGSPFDFDVGFEVACEWVKVITYADASSCTVASESFRCEAAASTGDGLCPPCSAIPSRLEIVELCGGPLGPWSGIDNESHTVSGCGPNLLPPEDPLCACAPIECEAP